MTPPKYPVGTPVRHRVRRELKGVVTNTFWADSPDVRYDEHRRCYLETGRGQVWSVPERLLERLPTVEKKDQ